MRRRSLRSILKILGDVIDVPKMRGDTSRAEWQSGRISERVRC